MQLTILGSGNFIPSLSRNPAGYLLQVGEENLIFDFGSGVLKSLLKAGLDFKRIDNIFLTHDHADHIEALIPFFSVCHIHRETDLNIFGFKGVEKFIYGIFGVIIGLNPENYKINFTEMNESKIDIDGIKIKSKLVKHSREGSLGFRVEADEKIFAYSGDTGACDNLTELAKDADVLVADCNFPDELKMAGHLTPSEAGEIAQKAGVKKLVLSHLSPECDDYDIQSQAKATFNGEVVVAEDMMKIEI